MGYIVDLSVILADIFRSADKVSAKDAVKAMDRHITSVRKNDIHHDIHRFVTKTYPTTRSIVPQVPQSDLVLEKIVALIRKYCVSSP
jgi:hypothetical protein